MGELADFLRQPLETIRLAAAGTSDLNTEYSDIVPPPDLLAGASRTPAEAEASIQKAVGHTVIGPSSI